MIIHQKLLHILCEIQLLCSPIQPNQEAPSLMLKSVVGVLYPRDQITPCSLIIARSLFEKFILSRGSHVMATRATCAPAWKKKHPSLSVRGLVIGRLRYAADAPRKSDCRWRQLDAGVHFAS